VADAVPAFGARIVLSPKRCSVELEEVKKVVLNAAANDQTLQQSSELPLLFFSGMSASRAARVAGLCRQTVRPVSLALRYVQDAILSSATVH
jgi:hypothetical protein